MCLAILRKGNAVMRGVDWEELRYFLVLFRRATIASAAKELHVNESTVSRKIRRAEERLGIQIFQKNSNSYELTSVGTKLISHLQSADIEIEKAIQYLNSECDVLSGTVRITAVPSLVNRILIPKIGVFLDQYNLLEVEFVADGSDLSLINREADIAIRLARPSKEFSVISQKIGTLEYAVYCTFERLAQQVEGKLPWIGYEHELDHILPAKWISEKIEKSQETDVGLRVNDAESLIQAVKSGLGKSLLPKFMGENEEKLTRLDEYADLPTREIWLLSHPDLKKLDRIRVVAEWLKRIF